MLRRVCDAIVSQVTRLGQQWRASPAIRSHTVTPEDLASQLLDAATTVLGRRETAGGITLTTSDIALERPRNRDHGDWSSNLAMKLAKRVGANPRELAIAFAEQFRVIEGVASVEVAGPGFINLTLEAAAAGALAQQIVERGDGYGHNSTLDGQSINLEFVSANPSGPLHIGHTRWAALGDSLARVLRASGATVATEFYINDTGRQMDNFGASILAAARGLPTPENGYPGAYIAELAERVLDMQPELLELDADAALADAREIGYQLQLAEIRESLERFNVRFDVWFSERELHDADALGMDGRSRIDLAIDRLRAQGHVYDDGDAVWVRTTDFGDDKDRVIRRGNGIFTYFAADSAYYLSKGDRGFAHKIYLLGADHHGYVHRLKALAGAAGDDPERDIEVLIGQLVSINGARLSKRAGNVIELNDLQAWLGTDALRYSLARYPADSPLTLDPELLKRRTNDNPVFYVQYAHARICSVLRDGGVAMDALPMADLSALTHEKAEALAVKIADFPTLLATTARELSPHLLPYYLREVAAAFHTYYNAERFLVDDLRDRTARLALAAATAQVLKTGLQLLGVSAPERM